jgi:hypothetical protein
MSKSASLKLREDTLCSDANFFGCPHALLSMSACPACVDAIRDDNRPAAAKHATCKDAMKMSGKERLKGVATLLFHSTADLLRPHSAFGAVIALRRRICCW